MQTTLALMTNVPPEILDIPVVVAGSIVDGRGMAAALLMGASGVQMGLRFLLAEECWYHPEFQSRHHCGDGYRFRHHRLYAQQQRAVCAANSRTNTCAWNAKARPMQSLPLTAAPTRLLSKGMDVNGVVQVGQGLNRLNLIQPAKEIVEKFTGEMTEPPRDARNWSSNPQHRSTEGVTLCILMKAKNLGGIRPQIHENAGTLQKALRLSAMYASASGAASYNTVARGDVDYIVGKAFKCPRLGLFGHVAKGFCIIGDYVTIGHSLQSTAVSSRIMSSSAWARPF